MFWNKNKTQPVIKQNICSVDQNLPECNLIEQIRTLQKQKSELSINVPKPDKDAYNLNYGLDYGYGLGRSIYELIDAYNHDGLIKFRKYIDEVIKYTEEEGRVDKEENDINKKIIELKSKLGIR